MQLTKPPVESISKIKVNQIYGRIYRWQVDSRVAMLLHSHRLYHDAEIQQVDFAQISYDFLI